MSEQVSGLLLRSFQFCIGESGVAQAKAQKILLFHQVGREDQ